MSEGDGFYEDDEPIEEIRSAFDAAEKGITAPPGLIVPMTSNVHIVDCRFTA